MNPLIKFLTLVGCLISMQSYAATVKVVSADGTPVGGAVVEVLDDSFVLDADLPIGTMDQVDRQFKPYILVVQKGALVDFPNSDSIKHHVFSFSKAKRFQLKLYRDVSPDPLLMDNSGVVALGCNIHDWMVGYIYVAESSKVVRTNREGDATFEGLSGNYSYRVWHPRIQQSDLDRRETGQFGDSPIEFKLEKTLFDFAQESADEFGPY